MKIDDVNPNLSILKTKRYALYWISSLFSNIGTWMQQVAQPWIMLTISHSTFLVGLDSFAMNAPGWILTLWGGVLADRLDRKKIILFFQGIQFLAILTLLTLLFLGLLKPWIIIVISLVVGITDSLSMPSFQSIIPSIVKKAEIPRAITLNSIQFNLSRTLGPAIAGIVMARYGALACFGANAFSYIPFFLSVYWIYPKKKNLVDTLPPSNPKITLMAGLKDVIKSDGIRDQLLNIFVTTLFCSPLVTFSPVIISEMFFGTSRDFGNISTAFGLGGLLGALLGFFFATKFKEKTPVYFGLSMGALIIGIACNHSLNVLYLLMLIGGAILTVANTSANSNIQFSAADHTRGRYASLFQLSFRGGLALGALLTGVCSSYLGISKALMINGLLAIAIHSALLIKKIQPSEVLK